MQALAQLSPAPSSRASLQATGWGCFRDWLQVWRMPNAAELRLVPVAVFSVRLPHT